jgi:hypothetical protein
MKVRALKKFEGIKDLERNVFPKENDVWETSEERAKFLKSHGFIEYVEKEKGIIIVDTKEESEKIIPLDKENITKIGKKIQEHIKDKSIEEKPKKRKTVKRRKENKNG